MEDSEEYKFVYVFTVTLILFHASLKKSNNSFPKKKLTLM